ncbi:MAG TPA: general secretion pathway protein GspK [Candidatus Acidoferrum sp.]|nr:general secretion pathway protein GspK [Candidatus Acidoferrum sp.]
MRPHVAPLSRAAQQGIALIVVMISIFVLSMLAGGFAYSMKVETKLARNGNSEEELQWLGRSGVEYARWILAQQMMIAQEPYDGLDQVWAGGPGGIGTSNSPLADVQKEVQLADGSFTWEIKDLERKWNVNAMLAPGGDTILQNAFAPMNMDAGDVTPVVNSILDWMDGGKRIQGADAAEYERLNPPYSAKNGPIDDISELLLVKGVTDLMYWGTSSPDHPISTFIPPQNRSHMPDVIPDFKGLVDLFTAVSDGKININTAPVEVLQMIPNITPEAAQAIVSGREGLDDGSGLTGPYRNLGQVSRMPEITPEMGRIIAQYGDVRSRTFQVNVTATVNGYTRYFTAILGRNNPRDVQVLSFYWSDPEDQKH